MQKIKLNAIINLLGFVIFLISSFSGVVLWKIFPSGTGFQGGRNLIPFEFFGFFKYEWSNIHIISSLIFVAIVFIHLILHWSWIKNMPSILKN